MPGRQQLVLETSQIFTAWEETRNTRRRKIGRFQVGDIYKEVWSTGVLELAIEQGIEVYVASTRRRLDSRDTWWRELVGEEHVFLADGSDDYSSGWMRCFDTLDVPYPRDPDGDPEFWVRAKWELHKHGIQLGDDFVKDNKKLLINEEND